MPQLRLGVHMESLVPSPTTASGGPSAPQTGAWVRCHRAAHAVGQLARAPAVGRAEHAPKKAPLACRYSPCAREWTAGAHCCPAGRGSLNKSCWSRGACARGRRETPRKSPPPDRQWVASGGLSPEPQELSAGEQVRGWAAGCPLGGLQGMRMHVPAQMRTRRVGVHTQRTVAGCVAGIMCTQTVGAVGHLLGAAVRQLAVPAVRAKAGTVLAGTKCAPVVAQRYLG